MVAPAEPAHLARRAALTTTIAAAATNDTASSAQIQAGQCNTRPSVSGTSSATIAMPSSAVPGRSTEAGRGERVAGT